MLKRLFLFISIATTLLSVSGQIPEGYYDDAIGKKGYQLRRALSGIIDDHTVISYRDLWEAYPYTDATSENKVWDIYSDRPGSTPPYLFDFADRCGNYSSEGDCYNREHSVPKSWFNEAAPMNSDLFHLYPTDGYVNNRRSNLPYGEVGSSTWTSRNGSKLGNSSVPGYSGNVFEPIDAYKGDLARTYFYMTVRYMDENLGQESFSMFQRSTLKPWALEMLLRWHENDPVSEKEVDRNNAIYSQFQHNRNPFIDYPELVRYLFTADSTVAWYPDGAGEDTTGVASYSLHGAMSVSIYPNPASERVFVRCAAAIDAVEVCDMAGRVVWRSGAVGAERVEIDVATWEPSCYFVRMRGKGFVTTKKLIIK